MADLADCFHVYGQDLAVTPSGDIAVATKSDRTIQRIIRRLLTSPTNSKGSAYPWQPGYGVGLGAKIGEALDVRAIAGAVRSQMLLEPTVRKVPSPVISVTEIANGANISITYFDQSGLPKGFNFDLVP